MEFTACVDCENFINKEPDGPGKDIWYNHLCKAAPLRTKQDPYDGKVKPYLGGGVFIEEEYENCREINHDGNCNRFSRKEIVTERKRIKGILRLLSGKE